MLAREVLASYIKYADTFQHIEHQIAQSMMLQIVTAKMLFEKIRSAYMQQAFYAGATAVIGGGLGIAGEIAAANKATYAETLTAVSRAIGPLGEIPQKVIAGNQSRD